MSKVTIPKGTLLNTATVAIGATIGVLFGKGLAVSYHDLALAALGLVTVGIGIKMFLQAKNILIVAAALVMGGMLGLALGIQVGIDSFAEWAKHSLGGSGRFTEAIVTSSVLFCVGPVTLLGCIQDGIEGKIELLAYKSLMDGVASIFLASALGPGVFVSAAVVLVIQSLITWFAKPLSPLAKDEEMLAETTASGGLILAAIGLGLLNIRKIPSANFIPALILAPLLVVGIRRFFKQRLG